MPPESAVPAAQGTSVTAEPGLAQTAPAGQAPAPELPVQCDPAADCVPVDATPVTVHLTSVTTDLTMVWDADGTVWLLPAYTFSDADGGKYTVIAVTDEYLQLANPDVVPEPPATDVPATDVPVEPHPDHGRHDRQHPRHRRSQRHLSRRRICCTGRSQRGRRRCRRAGQHVGVPRRAARRCGPPHHDGLPGSTG